MIQKIGNYYLKQDINTAKGLEEFSEEKYLVADQVGMKRILEDEKIFDGPGSEFASITWEHMTIASTKGQIYKIGLDSFTDKKNTKAIIKTVVKYINKEIGRYSRHSFFSGKYNWDTTEGNIILNRVSKGNIHAVNVFFTSNIIREQMLKLLQQYDA